MRTSVDLSFSEPSWRPQLGLSFLNRNSRIFFQDFLQKGAIFKFMYLCSCIERKIRSQDSAINGFNVLHSYMYKIIGTFENPHP